MDDLRDRICFQWDTRDCNILCLTETWLMTSVPDTILSRSCSPHLEHLSIICYPFYLPREISSIIVTAVYRQTLAWLCPKSMMCSAATLKNTQTLPLSSLGTLTTPTSGRSCQTFTNIYPVQLEDRIYWIIATLSLKMQTMPAHYLLLANQTMPPFSSIPCRHTPEYKQRLVQEPLVEREVTRWSSHSEAMLQASLDDFDWDMYRASTSDISEFTDVAISYVGMHRSDTEDRYRLRSSHFLRIGYRSDETDPNPILCF